MDNNIEVSVARMEVQVKKLEEDVSEMKGDIKSIIKTLDRAEGGWKLFLLVAGFSAAVGGLITKVISVWPVPK